MPVDEKNFFREATLRICGSLNIHVAMQRCLEYIINYIPATKMLLNLYLRDLGVIQGLSAVTVRGIEKPISPTPMPAEAVSVIETTIERWKDVLIINHPEAKIVPRILFNLHGKPNLSIMVMHLVIDGKDIGILSLLMDERGKYTEHHAHLLSILREPFTIAVSNALRYQELLRLKETADAENRELSRELRYLSGDEMVGADSGLKQVMNMVRQVAPVTSPVLLVGETGVGKEVIANAILNRSNRKDKPFIKVNCGAIPENLIDSELFGHEKGAFTGAIAQKRGRFERADKGTIFLDEIGDLHLQAQTRLLRVIQQKEIERVGGIRPIPVDVRIIAATHRDLEEMIDEGRFREDLWFRLNIFPIMIPPLRQRKDDIPGLVHHFIERKSKELKIHSLPKVLPESMERLKAYHWPGNVRELENLVERALIQCRGKEDGRTLTFDHFLYPAKKGERDADTHKPYELLSFDVALSRHIRKALQLTHGKIYGKDGAARLLEINPNTLRSKMKKMGISPGAK